MAKDVIRTPNVIAKICDAVAKLLYWYRLKALTAIAEALGLKWWGCDGLPLQKQRVLIGRGMRHRLKIGNIGAPPAGATTTTIESSFSFSLSLFIAMFVRLPFSLPLSFFGSLLSLYIYVYTSIFPTIYLSISINFTFWFPVACARLHMRTWVDVVVNSYLIRHKFVLIPLVRLGIVFFFS